MQCSTQFCSGCGKQSPFSFVTGPKTRIETGKAIIGEIVPQALKSYQHEGWDWLGGHLWPHALSWHEVALAMACQFPPAPDFPIPLLHQALLPGLFSPTTLPPLFFPTPLHACYCFRIETINRTVKKKKICTVRQVWHKVEAVFSHCPLSDHDGDDCRNVKGRKCLWLALVVAVEAEL